jgi:hypothetical protein
VPAVYPGVHRRQPTTARRRSTLLFWHRDPASWGLTP